MEASDHRPHSGTPSTPTTPSSWVMYAHDEGVHGFMNVEADPHITALYGPEPVVPVIVTPDPDGPYTGWVHTGDDELSLVQRREIFAIQFPYGPEAEQADGRGRIVRVRIEIDPTRAAHG